MKVHTNLKAGTSKSDAAICSTLCPGSLQEKYNEGYVDGYSVCTG